MLATLFDFPFEERRKLTWWSEVATLATSPDGPVISEAHRLELLEPCVTTFSALLAQRTNEPVRSDMISMLAHSEMAAMDPQELMGTLILLIVGGNDTTRNSISAGSLLCTSALMNGKNCEKIRHWSIPSYQKSSAGRRRYR